MNINHRPEITAAILAGGESRRMQGIDKGLIDLHGRPLISYALDIIKPQVKQIIINANRNLNKYQHYGYPVIKDDYPGFEGPLAGIASCLGEVDTSLMVCIPCDSPVFPADLVDRLYQTLSKENAEICIVDDGDRPQPVFVLMKTTLLDSLQRFLQSGERKTDKWYENHNVVLADFSDKRQLFININTDKELTMAEDYIIENS